MQTIATGVGDLKKVLSNVKTKGTFGEYQLGNILEQILTPDQYEQNVQTNPDYNGSIEYAVKLMVLIKIIRFGSQLIQSFQLNHMKYY